MKSMIRFSKKKLVTLAISQVLVLAFVNILISVTIPGWIVGFIVSGFSCIISSSAYFISNWIKHIIFIVVFITIPHIIAVYYVRSFNITLYYGADPAFLEGEMTWIGLFYHSGYFGAVGCLLILARVIVDRFVKEEAKNA